MSISKFGYYDLLEGFYSYGIGIKGDEEIRIFNIVNGKIITDHESIDTNNSRLRYRYNSFWRPFSPNVSFELMESGSYTLITDSVNTRTFYFSYPIRMVFN